MSFKVVNTFKLPDLDFGENLLDPFMATLASGLWHSEDEIIANAVDADAVICSSTHQPISRRVLTALHRCRIIASVGVGYSQADLQSATELGIVVTNVPDYCIDEVSGRAIAFIMALGHKLIQLDRAVKEKQVCFLLDRKSLQEVAAPIFRMRNQTVGVIGLGRIGLATAMKAKGLGMRVIGYDPYVFGPVMESWGVTPVDLNTLLRESDFVSIHAPLTTETRGMFGEAQFARIKPTAYLINVARGDCVDEAALVRALQEKRIAGAGLDVTADECVAADNPLLQMPNVILTGHSAAYSEEAYAELWSKPMTQVIAAMSGEFPQYAVNADVKKKWLDKWVHRAAENRKLQPVAKPNRPSSVRAKVA